MKLTEYTAKELIKVSNTYIAEAKKVKNYYKKNEELKPEIYALSQAIRAFARKLGTLNEIRAQLAELKDAPAPPSNNRPPWEEADDEEEEQPKPKKKVNKYNNVISMKKADNGVDWWVRIPVDIYNDEDYDINDWVEVKLRSGKVNRCRITKYIKEEGGAYLFKFSNK